jgi:beta-lactamase superfamily II metal-dependent hydrolase
MNEGDEERGGAGVNILWPDLNNEHFKQALAEAEEGGSPNNMSAVVKYALKDGVTALWFGDLHMEFMELIEDKLDIPPAHIVFAPHHGRRTGRIPKSILSKIDPKIIVIGEAATEHLDYYTGYDTITQNSSGDIIFDCAKNKVHVFTSKEYEVDYLDDESMTLDGAYYVGTLNLV